ncbi:MAG TPA: YtxH domain-containing protein [Desulfobulbus sp.]|nr:YtxH domain-containing protein [Desulfobulbus sp.]
MADQTLQQQVQPQPVYQQPVPAPVYQQPVQPTYPVAPTTSLLGLDVQDTQFWKGALLGAAVTLLVTNESVQKGVVKTVSKLTLAAQSGVEEMKEKFEDAKAEAEAETKASATVEPAGESGE